MCRFTKYFLLITFLACVLGNPTPRKTGFGPGEQDWGWVKVRTGANIFYWLYFTTAKVNSFYDRPLIIWLQGGPGGSSTGYGNFAEIGPLNVNLTERTYAWTKYMNVLFLDNPVGVGFGYVDNNSYLCRNNIQVGQDFIVFLTEFYKRHPGFKRTPLYIFGESYGGKMGVEMAKQLDEKIKSGAIESYLQGVILLDSWISPMDSVYGWLPLLLRTGLIDERSNKKLTVGVNNIQKAMDMGQFSQATDMWRALERDIMTHTNGVDFYNILNKVSPLVLQETSSQMDTLNRGKVEDELREISKVMNGPVKNALKIPYNIYHGVNVMSVFNALKEDFMKPVTHVVEHLLNNTNVEVTVLSGQLDLIVDTYGTLHWVDRLRWKGSSVWANARRVPLVVKSVIEGYVTKANNLAFYWINRSGHMVPQDNPTAAMEILRRVTKFDSR